MRRIRIDLQFGNETDADEVWGALKNYLKNRDIKSIVGETSFIEYEECHHDQSPPQPCEIIEKFEKELV